MSKIEVEKLFKQLSNLEDKEAFLYILDKKEMIDELEIVIKIDNDDVSLCWYSEDEEDDLTFTFKTFNYRLLDNIFNALGFNSDLV